MQITINEDTSFFIADELGDATAGNEQGFYFEDTRFLSAYQLRLNDHALRLLTARTLEHYHAVHLLSNPVGDKLAPESLTIARHRLVGRGLHEDLEVTSHLDEPLVLVLELRVAADFLHIFQVRGHSSDEPGTTPAPPRAPRRAWLGRPPGLPSRPAVLRPPGPLLAAPRVSRRPCPVSRDPGRPPELAPVRRRHPADERSAAARTQL